MQDSTPHAKTKLAFMCLKCVEKCITDVDLRPLDALHESGLLNSLQR